MEIDSLSPAPAADPFLHTFKPRKHRPSRQVKNRDGETGSATPEAAAVDTPQTADGITSDAVMTPAPPDDDTVQEGDSLSVAEILRLRKQAKPKKRGLDFTVDRRAKTPTAEEEEAIAEKDAVDKEVNAVVNRFTGQTGAIVDVNEHMMKFIESELAKRRMEETSQPLPVTDDEEDPNEKRVYPAPLTSTKISERRIGKWPVRPDFRGATLGKLQEIDLGAESTRKNVERTEEAKRRLAAGEPWREPEPEDPKKKKRGKRRRNSLDIERDKLVEEVLKESRLDIYEEPDLAAGKAQPDEDDMAADDRIAEQFRREFMDAQSARRRGRANNNKKKDDPKRPRGPKLGGSRAARAAMRESEKAAGKR
ncbi:hypothetical protein Dda_7971 [Drechslerella dactyloides]|uniref:Hepatocellular carcinoma-associated antigen 59-domain-containing protein n=1 Tax=Drechslerella dactyloides TaxID=74499 RepID=A0AAD6IUN8_DREDA|nr:hypothetical protein Dda_7971 [Drechslerella dactyloides]